MTLRRYWNGSRPGRRTGSRNWWRSRSKSEAELAGAEYDATPDELAAVDEGLAVEAANEEEVKATFALFRKK